MNNTLHNRKSDVDQEYQHTRSSDAVLLDLLSSVKMINNKQDALAADVSEVRKSNEVIRDRLTRVEGNQSELSNQIKDTKELLGAHAKEEENILTGHMTTLNHLHVELGKVQRGFPKNEDGERDPRSHADEHEIEASKKKDMSTMMKDIRKWMVISFLAAIGTGVLYLLATGTRVEISRVANDPMQNSKPIGATKEK